MIIRNLKNGIVVEGRYAASAHNFAWITIYKSGKEIATLKVFNNKTMNSLIENMCESIIDIKLLSKSTRE